MKPRDQKFIESWSKTRKMGMTKFMLLFGGIWGVLTAVILQLFKLNEMSFQEAFLSLKFAVQFIIFLVTGVLIFGLVLWKMNENKYSKLTNQD